MASVVAGDLGARDGEHDTLSERAAAFLERDILDGALQPGDRLAIAQLAARYGIGATPLREAMTHLSARGLVLAIGQRGFRVAGISRADLEDITRLRMLVETEALRRSIANGSDEWEAGILSMLHKFRRAVERAGDDFREGSVDIDRTHKAFHTALIAGCDSPRILQLHSDLYDQAYRYRRLVMKCMPDAAGFIREHEELAGIVIARQFAQSSERLVRHLDTTLDAVYGDGK